MNQVYNELLMKKQQMEILAQQGKRKYEYDSGIYQKKHCKKMQYNYRNIISLFFYLPDEETEVSDFLKANFKVIVYLFIFNNFGVFKGRYMGT